MLEDTGTEGAVQSYLAVLTSRVNEHIVLVAKEEEESTELAKRGEQSNQEENMLEKYCNCKQNVHREANSES